VLTVVVGPSASGKDTYLENGEECRGCKRILQHTTRPKRKGETNGVEYRFVDLWKFSYNYATGKYLEAQSFRGWWYGTPERDFRGDKSYCCAMSPRGLMSLKDEDLEHVKLVYLRSTPALERVRRSLAREGPKLEIFRRLNSDRRDFRKFDRWLREHRSRFYRVVMQ
jgi:guanylate kinase